MKKLIAVIVMLSMLAPSALAANGFYTDWSRYTDDELREIISEAQAELDRRSNPQSGGGFQKNKSYTVNDISFSVIGNYVYKDGNKNYLVVKINWTNNGSSAQSYLAKLSVHAYQNGVELERGYVYNLETNEMTNILPGYDINVYELFELTNNSDVTITIDTYFDLTDKFDDIIYTVSVPDLKEIKKK